MVSWHSLSRSSSSQQGMSSLAHIFHPLDQSNQVSSISGNGTIDQKHHKYDPYKFLDH